MLQYLDLGFHTEDFRQSYLLPISEAFSFHEFIPILNTAIDARLEAEIDAGTNLGDAASRPLVVDFEVPLQAAGRRKRVFKVYQWMHKDKFGLAQDDGFLKEEMEKMQEEINDEQF